MYLNAETGGKGGKGGLILWQIKGASNNLLALN